MSPFIVIEGPDGSGTTLHSQLLTAKLLKSGVNVLPTSEPTNGPIGKHIRSMLNGEHMPQPDAVQLLFCADRAQHVETEILPALERGETVICDRYSLSTLIYGAEQGLDLQWLESINSRFPSPDLTIVTLPPFEVCQERLGRRSEADQFEKREFQKHIYNRYAAIQDPRTVFVDTSGEKQEVAEAIWEHVAPLLQKASRKDIADIEVG